MPYDNAPFPDLEPAPFRYRTVFISDLHLGSTRTAAPYLYEFLSHLDFSVVKDIYIVGDAIGGSEHRKYRQQPFPEIERRCLDVLNYADSIGVRLHVIPGNHDEELLPLLDMLNDPGRSGMFGSNTRFVEECDFETGGPDSKRLKVLHGHKRAPIWYDKPAFLPLRLAVDAGYYALIESSHHVSHALYKTCGTHARLAAGFKAAARAVIEPCFFHKAMAAELAGQGYDGAVMGHTHMPGVKIFHPGGKPFVMINDGDWMESCTAAVVGEEGGLPRVMDYRAERRHHGFATLPDVADAHPARFAAFRPQTDRQVQMIHRLWPARDRSKIFAQYAAARRDLSALFRAAGGEEQMRELAGTMRFAARKLDFSPAFRKGRGVEAALPASNFSGIPLQSAIINQRLGL
jgi:UDP-2,3-diacylglucosamine pyrophosphatase LpxH